MNDRNRIFAGALVALLLAGTPALAIDGVIEINQVKVMAGGVTAGDNAGFPVFINTPGSYVLTGDLAVPAGTDGIWVQSDDVTLDLNGFTIAGAGGSISDGISLLGFRNTLIRDGTVRGFSRYGIFSNAFTHFVQVTGVRVHGNAISGIELQGGGNLVDRCVAFGNGSGIRVLDGSLITESVARGNTGYGFSLGLNSAYQASVLTDNNGGNANPQVVGGGFQIGSSLCGSDLVCP